MINIHGRPPFPLIHRGSPQMRHSPWGAASAGPRVDSPARLAVQPDQGPARTGDVKSVSNDEVFRALASLLYVAIRVPGAGTLFVMCDVRTPTKAQRLEIHRQEMRPLPPDTVPL